MRQTGPVVSPSEPEISVVVATRNRAERLRRLLSSLREQTFPAENFEVLVIDDGSDDATGSVLANAQSHDGVALRGVRNERPRGPGASRNTGWRQARGRLIAFIDDDCEAAADWLHAGWEAWRERPDVFVQGMTSPNAGEEGELGPFAYTIRVERLGPHYETCNIFYPRTMLDDLGGFDDQAFPGGGEDCDLGWRAIEAGASPVFAPAARAEHAVHTLGPLGQLRRAGHWTGTMLVFARHPGLRDAYLHNRVFWQVRHQMLVRLLLAALLPRRLWTLRFLLAAPYFIHARQRAHYERTSVLLTPYYLVHDLVEMFAVVRGALRYRTVVI